MISIKKVSIAVSIIFIFFSQVLNSDPFIDNLKTLIPENESYHESNENTEEEDDEIVKIFPPGDLRDAVYVATNIAFHRIVTLFFFSRFKYFPNRSSNLYRNEGYPSFPDQEKYIRKYGILSKRLVAKILDIEPERLVNDCKLNYERMGDIYKKAYWKIEQDEGELHLALFELYKEIFEKIKINPNSDPMKDLCYLHFGECMWESYLISTGDRRTALKYSGKTYKFTPKPGAFPLTFDTKIHCGETKNAVLLWISPSEYFIERVR